VFSYGKVSGSRQQDFQKRLDLHEMQCKQQGRRRQKAKKMPKMRKQALQAQAQGKEKVAGLNRF